MDEYDDIYQVDCKDEWINGAYDENGDSAVCDICGEEMKWDPTKHNYKCSSCGQEMDRAAYFNHIGADPPSAICLTRCRENYPFCKSFCIYFDSGFDESLT